MSNSNTDIIYKEIFNLIIKQKFKELYKIIKTGKLSNFDFKDNNHNYFIQYIVNYNQYNILQLILDAKNTNDINIRLDILDIDGRSLLYNCIKYNYTNLFNILIQFNKLQIGISIIDIKDTLGLTALHYTIIYNNFDMFKILIENQGDPYIVSKDGFNVFQMCLIYKRNNILVYLIESKLNLNFTSLNGETLLQLAINYENTDIATKLLNSSINLNNRDTMFGLNALQQTIILDNFNLYKQLLNTTIDLNSSDFYGNTPLHYILIDKRLDYLPLLLEKQNIYFNIVNINGEIPLHILLDIDINLLVPNSDSTNTESNSIDMSILTKIILESDLNIQDNQGITCLMKIIKLNLHNTFRDLLVIKPLNFFIEDNSTNTIILTDDIIIILVESYYNQIKINKDELIIDWEKWCNIGSFDKLKEIITTDISGKTSEEICKSKIKSIITKEKRTLPKLSNMELVLDNGIFTNFCSYTGLPIDILFGLLLLKQEFKIKGLSLIIDYPLTINKALELYYKNIGVNQQYKIDFSNIEIVWCYQKLFYPSYFTEELTKVLKYAKYICIPIGIEISTGSHANMLFWDVRNKTIERFEPNGSNYPIGLNYNPELLDTLLNKKFKQFDPNIKYIEPYKFLPSISLQILEDLETPKCKKIGDPNGFCAVWCIWWVYQRMLNIDNNKLNVYNFASEFIKIIKFDNKSFKSIIRNFSKRITQLRDSYLKKYNLDINDWIVSNYSDEILNNMEKEIFNNIKK